MFVQYVTLLFAVKKVCENIITPPFLLKSPPKKKKVSEDVYREAFFLEGMEVHT